MLGRDEFLAVHAELAAAHNARAALLGLLVIDLRRFHRINAIYGYDKGDELIGQVAARILKIKRSQDLLGRIGDNEFALLLTDLRNEGHAVLAANRLIAILSEFFQLDQSVVAIEATLGIALLPLHASDAPGHMQCAEAALRSAKDGGQPYHVYSPVEHSVGLGWDIETELEHAIKNNDFELHFQPKLSFATGFPDGAEALLRWHHPKHGWVPVERLIAVAEVTGKINPITRWVINTTMRLSEEWPQHYGDLHVAVNLSPSVFRDREFIDFIKNSLMVWGFDARRMTFEVTESGIMDDPGLSLEMLNQLRALGAGISIDDFGTGYSSLSYFKQLPATELKIDRSFVGNMLNDVSDQKLVHSVIGLAKGFNLLVVAEGIEDADTLKTLINMGCDIGQGYHIARPMPQEQLISWLDAYPASPLADIFLKK